jgi:hypothetical protein
MKALKLICKILLACVITFSFVMVLLNLMLYKEVNERLCVVEGISCAVYCNATYGDDEDQMNECVSECVKLYEKCVN